MSGALGFQAKRALARSQEMREPVQRSLFGDDVPVRAGDADAEVAQFRSTGYETVRQLLDHLRLPGGHWVEPCAGEGHIVRYVARWCDEHEKPRPSFWTCIELRDDGALWDLACLPEDVTKNLGPEYRGSCGKVWVHSPQDLLTFEERDNGVSAVITNMPWPGWTERGLWERMRWLWPQAEIVAHTWVQEFQDGPRNPETNRPARAQWLDDHKPNRFMLCAGRQVYSDSKSAYPHPVAWLHWERGVECAEQTYFEVLR